VTAGTRERGPRERTLRERAARGGTVRVRGDGETDEPGHLPAFGLRLRGPAWLDGPMTTSHLVLGSAGLLLAIGLIMVFSASSIEAALDDQPAWLPGARQIVFAVIGLAGMVAAMRLPVGRIRQWSGPAMLVVVGLLLLVLVPGVGLKLNGSRAWFNLGVTNFQPSEVAKLVYGLWGAHVIATRTRYLTTKTLLVPVLPVFGIFSLLLLAEPDMGAVVSLGLVLAGLMWAGGLSWRWIGAAVLGAAGLVAAMVVLAPYRMARITSFLDPFADPTDGGYQAVRGLYALATGGFWGVGLGNSAMKWNLLPHAESDYIFAIIGEELGLLGCVVVVSLYGILAYAGFRIARRTADRFIQLASVAITVWLIGQATMNMGYVVGLLPVTGVQLPLISAGGTSLVLTLFIVGLLARFARSEPEAIAHLRSQHRSRLARLLLPAPAEAVDPLPARRRTRPRPSRVPRDDGRTVAGPPAADRRPGGPHPHPDPHLLPHQHPGHPDQRSAGQRARQGPATPPEPPARRDRQTVRGRPPAGDLPPLRLRPPAAAPSTSPPVPRRRAGFEPPAPAPGGRPAARSHAPRTERPGFPQ
jgi:cell division protein FtsW